MTALVALTWTEGIGWALFVVAVLMGIGGALLIISASEGGVRDPFGAYAVGAALIGFAVALGTAGLTMAGKIDPDWLKDPFNL